MVQDKQLQCREICVSAVMCARSLEHGNDVLVFVDYEKVFDRVDWVNMLAILK